MTRGTPRWRNIPGTMTHESAAVPIVADGQQEQQLAIVQSLLAPFIEQLGATKVELGRVARRNAARADCLLTPVSGPPGRPGRALLYVVIGLLLRNSRQFQ